MTYIVTRKNRFYVVASAPRCAGTGRSLQPDSVRFCDR
jgi:hypothetical protein